MSYTYDSADRLDTVTDWAARVTRFRYDPATSRLARIELPNGTLRVFAYDSAGRVAGVRDEVAAGGSLVSQFTLGYDALDRIVEETPLPEPAPFTVTAAAMTYDDDDRLTAWNALTTESDADGNLTKGPLAGALATFAYDVRNRLTGVGTTSYTYDAENRRITRTATGVTTTFVHDPNAALSRLLQSRTGSTTTRYVYAGSLLLYAETGSALRVHHYDYRGSTVALTDATGAVLGRVTYGSYGEIVARTGDTATEFLYNGRDGVVTDPNGLYHMRARYYSPETRRFLNADPIGFGGGTNWYAYVGGSPVMSVDPIGLCPAPNSETLGVPKDFNGSAAGDSNATLARRYLAKEGAYARYLIINMAAGTSNTQLNVGEKGFSFFNHGPGKVLPLLAQGGGADTVNALLGLRTEQTQMTFFLIHGKDIHNSDAVFLPWNGNHVSVGDARVAFQERFPNLGERFDFVFCQRGNNPDLSIDNAYRQFILPTLEADAKDGGLMYRYETPRY